MTRRLLPARPARRALGAFGLAATATMLSGCIYLSPAQTTVMYDPGPGIDATVGSLKLSDVLVVTSAKDAPGTLHGMVTNSGGTPVSLSILPDGGSKQSVTVPAETAVRLDGLPSGNSSTRVTPVTIAKVGSQPGKPTTVTFSTAKVGATPVKVPVMLDQGVYGTASPAHPTYTPPPPTQKTEPNG